MKKKSERKSVGRGSSVQGTSTRTVKGTTSVGKKSVQGTSSVTRVSVGKKIGEKRKTVGKKTLVDKRIEKVENQDSLLEMNLDLQIQPKKQSISKKKILLEYYTLPNSLKDIQSILGKKIDLAKRYSTVM